MDIIESYPAHIREVNGDVKVQESRDHCCKTAEYARADLQSISLGNAAFLAGLLHDCGKFTDDFRKYICSSYAGEKVRKGSVIHTFAGVYYMLRQYHEDPSNDMMSWLSAEMIAYAIGAHHGLFDCIDGEKKNGFVYRLTKQAPYEEEAIAAFLADCEDRRTLDELFRRADREMQALINTKLVSAADNENKQIFDQELNFYLGMVARLLSSAVMDGDRRDTAEFMNGSDFSVCVKATSSIWRTCRIQVESLLNSFPCETAIQKARRDISELCADFAKEPGSIYRLNVPTGGGKTLSSLRYALAHAEQYGKKRIIYVAPLISILDQNAQVIRGAIQDDSLILEHHSNVVRSEEGDESERDLLAETWDAPVIITTMVQLLNTCFSAKTSCVRRFQSLCDSVIILDEVQSLPEKMLSMFNLTMNFLSEVCHATIILCSATQPCLESLNHQLHVSEKTMISKEQYDQFYSIFKRTELIDKGNRALEDIPELIHDSLKYSRSVLVICNTKKEASRLFELVKGMNVRRFHLSASMCMAHRKKVLDNLYKALDEEQKIVCIATQVIEAGVDISFGTVIRLTAGIDSIVQAAGRCNRNGESDKPAPVYIVRCQDEKLGNLQEIKHAQDAANQLLISYKKRPEQFAGDLASDEAVAYYYRSLYNLLKSDVGWNYFDYAVKNGPTIFDLLSENNLYAAEGNDSQNYFLHQAFLTAGRQFEVYDSEGTSVIVPYGDGEEVIAEFFSSRAKYDIIYLKTLIDKAKDYSVSVHKDTIQKLIRNGGVIEVPLGNSDEKGKLINGKIMVLRKEWYDSDTGWQAVPVEGERDQCDILIS